MRPQTKKRVQKPKGYQPIDTEGKLFRVRDKDYGDGSEVKIWGENLTYEAAHALKEKVVGQKKTRTARIEDMNQAMPSADPTLESVRQKGLAVGRSAAASAQQRANALAVRRRQEASAASAPKPKRPAPLAKPVAMDLDADLETPDIPDESELGEADELGAVEAEAEGDINEYEQKGRELYEAYVEVKGKAGHKPWPALSSKDQAAFSFEAASEQGPHIDAIRAATQPPAPEAPTGNGVTETPTAS